LEPRNSLLATAWPAFEEEIRNRFDRWDPLDRQDVEIGELTSIAAAEDNLLVMPRPTILRRLPPDFEGAVSFGEMRSAVESAIGLGDAAYERHEGGVLSRSLGNAVHKLLEELARLRLSLDWAESLAALEKIRPRITAMVRTAGVPLAQAQDLALQAFTIAHDAARDSIGQWILSPHSEAVSESGWAGITGGSLKLIRVDRLFRAGLQPMQPGDDAAWIIDYKTAQAGSLDAKSALEAFRSTYGPQLEAYAEVVRNLYDPRIPLRAGLYFPRMSLFDWWEI
jgi:hypothetical protein